MLVTHADPPPSAAAPATATDAGIDAHREVRQMLAEGYGHSARHPHVPFVAAGATGPVVMWQAHCTEARCGTYVDDVAHEPTVDYLCHDCESDPDS